ncbi:MAG: nickel-binding protein [Gaiellaceae bacterium]|jgi:hypothetical protein
MPTYIVERYVPRSTASDLRSEGERIAQAAQELAESGQSETVYVRSIYMPDDEISFCLLNSSSIDTVAECFSQAKVAFDRILEAEVLEP